MDQALSDPFFNIAAGDGDSDKKSKADDPSAQLRADLCELEEKVVDQQRGGTGLGRKRTRSNLLFSCLLGRSKMVDFIRAAH